MVFSTHGHPVKWVTMKISLARIINSMMNAERKKRRNVVADNGDCV